MQHNPHLKHLFAPDSVAVLGASRTPGKVGHAVVANIILSGYKGKVFPVNPKGGEIQGLPVTTDLEDLPDGLDLALICLPPEQAVAAVDALGRKGTRAVAVLSSGFKESGREGCRLEEDLLALARKRRMSLLGPNCVGLINTRLGLNATFAAQTPLPGNVAFFSQSGALCVAMLEWALARRIGLSTFASLGNKAMTDEADMLCYLLADPDTRVILGYCESLENGQAFMRAARKATREKPVIMIKAGNTDAGARAACSHTGALCGSAQACRTAFAQSGVIQARDMESLFNLAQAFATQPLPAGPNLLVVTNAGGPGILAADACARSRLNMVRPSLSTIEKLRQVLPPFAALYNPVDIVGDAGAERYEAVLRAVVEDEAVHAILVLVTPGATVAGQMEQVARSLAATAKKCAKPVFACLLGEASIAPAREALIREGIPCTSFPEAAVEAIEAMYLFSQWKTRPYAVEVCYRRDRSRAERIIREAKARGLTELVEFQAQELMAAYELPVPETRLARTSDEAVKAAKKMGFPVVLKIASPKLSHKTEVGGVRVNLNSPEEVQGAFLDITTRVARTCKEAYISGCLVQKMAPAGSKEVIIGFKRDPHFGPLVMFGLGGIHVEALGDVSHRLAPLTLGEAQQMVREIRAFPILRGMRGDPPVDFAALEDILLTISQLAMDFPEIHEADFNPVLVSTEGALVADVRLALD